jgi:hypothetical protein
MAGDYGKVLTGMCTLLRGIGAVWDSWGHDGGRLAFGHRTGRRAGRSEGGGMTEAEAHEFYKDPGHLAVAGAGERPPQPMKSGLIPVRFTPDTIAAVKRVAKQDGVTVSTWIRRLVDKELQRRLPSMTGPMTETPALLGNRGRERGSAARGSAGRAAPFVGHPG